MTVYQVNSKLNYHNLAEILLIVTYTLKDYSDRLIQELEFTKKELMYNFYQNGLLRMSKLVKANEP